MCIIFTVHLQQIPSPHTHSQEPSCWLVEIIKLSVFKKVRGMCHMPFPSTENDAHLFKQYFHLDPVLPLVLISIVLVVCLLAFCFAVGGGSSGVFFPPDGPPRKCPQCATLQTQAQSNFYRTQKYFERQQLVLLSQSLYAFSCVLCSYLKIYISMP